MQKFQVEGHEASFLPEGNWELTWSDEFDGTTLDESKWDYRLHMMQQRWISWTDKGVHLDGNSNAVFTLMEEDGRLCCSQLQTGHNYMDHPPTVYYTNTTDMVTNVEALRWPIGPLQKNKLLHGPGYYECRCRLQQKPGWWSAFWIQSPTPGCSLDVNECGVEIDIMEHFRPGILKPHNVFSFGYGADVTRIKVGGFEGLKVDEFHRFGLLWDETGYTFYVDGKEDGKITDLITTRPEFVLISTEVYGYRRPDRKPIPESFDAVGDTFLVDYVRIFDKKD